MINRKQQRQEIARLFNELGGGSKFKLLEFYGIGGLGKSRILNTARQECRDRGLPFAGIDFFPFGDQPTPHPELDILLRICDNLEKYTDLTHARLFATSMGRDSKAGEAHPARGLVAEDEHLAGFRKQLAEVLSPHPLILVLDSIEHCPDELFNWLGRDFLTPLVAEQEISSVLVFLSGRGPRVAESNWPLMLRSEVKSFRLDPLEFDHSVEHIDNLPNGSGYHQAAREIYALSNGHPYSTESIVHWLNSLGVKVEEVGTRRADLAKQLREEVIQKYILSDADKWVLPFLEIACYFRWFTSSYISEFISKYRPELGKNMPGHWYLARLVDLQKRPLHLVYLDRVHYRLEPTLQKLLHIVTAVLDPNEACAIHSEAIQYLENELQKNEAQPQKGLSSDNAPALIIEEILYHKAHLGAIAGQAIEARAELESLLGRFFDSTRPRDMEWLNFLKSSIDQDVDLKELLTPEAVKDLVEEIKVFLTPTPPADQAFRLSHLLVDHIEPSEYWVSWYQANQVMIPREKVISTQRFLLSDWQNETMETGKIAFTAYLPDRSQEFVRTNVDCAIQLTTNRVDIPWELLHDDHEFLCLSRPVGRRPQSLRDQRTLPFREPGPLRALVIGNPNGDLPGAEEEAQMIAEELSKAGAKVELFLRQNATARLFAKKIRNQQFDLIHFAGHAHFEPRAPDISGLSFQDSPMPAAELGRHLSSRAFVFLSACEAGMASVVGNNIGMLGDFVAGIATNILCGGAIGCVAPMWAIKDGVAKDFSIFFYKHLISEMIVGESLRQARLEVRTAHGPDDAWKAWVLYGDPTLRIHFGNGA